MFKLNYNRGGHRSVFLWLPLRSVHPYISGSQLQCSCSPKSILIHISLFDPSVFDIIMLRCLTVEICIKLQML